MGNHLLDLAEKLDLQEKLDAEISFVKKFYQCLFDAFNKKILTKIDQRDIEYQQRFVSSFKYGQEVVDSIIESYLEHGLNANQLIKIKNYLLI